MERIGCDMENKGMVYSEGAGPVRPAPMTLRGQALLVPAAPLFMTIWHSRQFLVPLPAA